MEAKRRKVENSDADREEDSLYSEVGNFYLNNDKLHDVQFIVGEQKEKIKAVKLPLINQSRTWWTMLSEESPLAEKDDISLPDIDPEVFMLVLKHSYGGLENLDDLSDDIVMKLCYCANKYFMKSLMTKIAARLAPKDVESVFPALHCLVYYNLHGVEDSVKKIVTTQTKKIFELPEFLECDVDSVTYICKQSTLNCDELTLWKAVVSWAKHKAQGGEGGNLRQWMSQPLQHIRLLSLSQQELFDHVFSLGILESVEIASICQKNAAGTSTFSDKKYPRWWPLPSGLSATKTINLEHTCESNNNHFSYGTSSASCIFVKNKPISLQSIFCRGFVDHSDFLGRDKLFRGKYKVDITIRITQIGTDHFPQRLPCVIILKDFEHYCFDVITVPTIFNNKGITLSANSRHIIALKFSHRMPRWVKPICETGHDFEHGTFYCSKEYTNGVGNKPCHILGFTYAFP